MDAHQSVPQASNVPPASTSSTAAATAAAPATASATNPPTAPSLPIFNHVEFMYSIDESQLGQPDQPATTAINNPDANDSGSDADPAVMPSKKRKQDRDANTPAPPTSTSNPTTTSTTAPTSAAATAAPTTDDNTNWKTTSHRFAAFNNDRLLRDTLSASLHTFKNQLISTLQQQNSVSHKPAISHIPTACTKLIQDSITTACFNLLDATETAALRTTLDDIEHHITSIISKCYEQAMANSQSQIIAATRTATVALQTTLDSHLQRNMEQIDPASDTYAPVKAGNPASLRAHMDNLRQLVFTPPSPSISIDDYFSAAVHSTLSHVKARESENARRRDRSSPPDAGTTATTSAAPATSSNAPAPAPATTNKPTPANKPTPTPTRYHSSSRQDFHERRRSPDPPPRHNRHQDYRRDVSRSRAPSRRSRSPSRSRPARAYTPREPPSSDHSHRLERQRSGSRHDERGSRDHHHHHTSRSHRSPSPQRRRSPSRPGHRQRSRSRA